MSALGRKRTLRVQAGTAMIDPMIRSFAFSSQRAAARHYYYACEVGTG